MISTTIKRFLGKTGYEFVRTTTAYKRHELNIMDKVREYTSTSSARISGLINAVDYVVNNSIEGDFVECGVWRGGSMMAAMYALLEQGDSSRKFHLFDTFEGMTAPTDKDIEYNGKIASEILQNTIKEEGQTNYWCWAGIDDVRVNVQSTGYPMKQVNLIKGPVEETIPDNAPERIALLRLDTDWYESTKHELKHLYDRLVPNGIMIIDDYGHWQGAQKAVDEFFEEHSFKPLLNRLDYTGRLIIKT